ncbi:MAG TPA: glycosyl hydrolase family 28 protein [bacterium]|nr:glycosyl hydrolase family 28 protein [bacterium]
MGIYKIEDFDIKGDGKTINTEAIQKAIDTCNENGGGKIIFSSGIFKTGTIELKSNVQLHLERGCKIIGSENPDDYRELEANGFLMQRIEPKKEMTKNALIIASESENISITGYGEINGSGLSFYKNTPSDENGKYNKPNIPRPRIIMFYKCKNVFIEGVKFVDSPCWTIWFMKCEDINIHNIRIFGNKRMRNIDGIDVDACKNVIISDCIMDTEDDCIAIRSMQNLYDEPAICENITVSNCILRTSCQGIRIGCPGDGIIQNCVFTNLIIEGARGIISQHPKIYLPENITDGADIHDIMFSNITIKSNLSPIWLYIENGIKLTRLSDINFSNIKIIKSGEALIIKGNEETKIYNITFNNLEMENSGENGIVCCNCENIRFDNFKLTTKQEKE